MKRRVLLIEPFFGGSHKQLIDFIGSLLSSSDGSWELDLRTLPAKKWHWRARTSALHFAQDIPEEGEKFHVLFCSSVLNLAELLALRPDLAAIEKKVIYFHENQLCYPVQTTKDRDFQYGYNQILSALVADVALFNSRFNRDSFLVSIDTFFKLQPDFRPARKSLRDKIGPKASVVYFPVLYPELLPATSHGGVLHIVWPHRWEHDKNPEAFFKVLKQLKDDGATFRVSVLGQQFSEVPEIFQASRDLLSEEILHWGYQDSKDDYWRVLRSSHVAVSTSNHEFFGVSMVESAFAGCFPLVPDRLVYPEIFPISECLYKSDAHLLAKLRSFCQNPLLAIETRPLNLDSSMAAFSMEHLREKYLDIFSTSSSAVVSQDE